MHRLRPFLALVLVLLAVLSGCDQEPASDSPTTDQLKTTPLVTIAPEGGYCGGFTTNEKQKTCAPGLVCATPPNVSDAAGICSLRPGVEALLAAPLGYLTRTVTLSKVYLRPGMVRCETTCDGGSCAKTCSAPLVIVPRVDALPTEESLVVRTADGEPLGCEIADNGVPACDLELTVWFLTGRVAALPHGGFALDLVRKSALYYD